jgi:uncharacterized protein (TIGR04255 family)
MIPGTRYPHAPITEAVIDIQCVASCTSEELANVNTDEGNRYPHIEKLQEARGQMLLSPDAAPIASATSEIIGLLHRSTDGLQIYQARKNGFTFSRLAQYTSWEEISGEARRLWDKYRQTAKPQDIKRIAVRYINRLDLPLPVQDFGIYLKTTPQLSSDLPQGLLGFFMQMSLPLPESHSICVINETIIDPPIKPNTVPVVLDIDVFRTTELSTNEGELWSQLEQLRHEKNRVFEACITDEARRLFQ